MDTTRKDSCANAHFIAQAVLGYAEQLDRSAIFNSAVRVEITRAEHDDRGAFWFFIVGYASGGRRLPPHAVRGAFWFFIVGYASGGRRLPPHAVRGAAGATAKVSALAEAYRASMIHELRRRGLMVAGPTTIEGVELR